jgi:hypothetical protein
MNTLFGVAQDPARLLPEVMALQAKYDTIWDNQRETIVFTGSSRFVFGITSPSSFPKSRS